MQSYRGSTEASTPSAVSPASSYTLSPESGANVALFVCLGGFFPTENRILINSLKNVNKVVAYFRRFLGKTPVFNTLL